MQRRFVWLMACVVLSLAVSSAFPGCVTDASSVIEADDEGSTNVGGGFGVGGGLSSAGGGLNNVVVGTLTGTVLAPEGTIPISGALVYLTPELPQAIPQQVFCDKCIELASDIPYTLSAADGTFTVEAYRTGEQFLVVQKGAFRRVRTVNVAEGDAMVDLALTTLPAASDPSNGDDIPKMAVLDGTYDDIENSLAKLGLGQVDSYGDLVSGTESFTLVQDSARNAFLTDYATLSQYHIVYFPCATSWPDGFLSDPNVIQNLRQYMNDGGRLYVTDYTYDVLRQTDANPISWLYDTGSYGSAESGYYDANSTATDQGLADWLGAQGITTFLAEANWTVIDSVNPYPANDEDGTATTFDPTVWVTGDVPGVGQKPLTVSYQHGCGRALFSTYHTESGSAPLLVQERALLYIILEVAVCIGDIGAPK